MTRLKPVIGLSVFTTSTAILAFSGRRCNVAARTLWVMEPLRLASLWSRALAGAIAIPVAVEVHLGNGLPQFQKVGS
jgi:hypothetical protein